MAAMVASASEPRSRIGKDRPNELPLEVQARGLTGKSAKTWVALSIKPLA